MSITVRGRCVIYRTATMILHSPGYKSDTETIFERKMRNREENDPYQNLTSHTKNVKTARALFDFTAQRPS